ncbi:MAG: hypothetical protein ACXVD5_13325 [Nocardioides sp.]
MSVPRAHQGRTLPVLLAALVLVGGANVAAYAANGHPLLLGGSNTASRTTTLRSTGHGAALTLKPRAGKPPLAVTSSAKVAGLNADLVDGRHASDLATTVRHYTVPASTPPAGTVGFPDLPAGVYLMSYSLVVTTASGVPVCFATAPGMSAAEGVSYSVPSGTGYFTNNATALVDTRGGALSIVCNNSSAVSFYSTDGDAHSSVAFTPVDTVVTGTSARPAPRTGARTGPVTGR